MLQEDLVVHGKRIIGCERALSPAFKECSKCAPNGCESDSAEQPETVTS